MMLMLTKIFRQSSKALTSQQKTILSAATVIASVYGLSALLGFVRNRLLSAQFGDSAELGIYFAADAIPSLIFTLVISGSLSTAFIPVFTKYFKKNEEEAWNVTSSVLTISLVLLLIFCIVVILGADFISKEVIARSSNLSSDEFKLLANLMRVMMVAQVGLIISSFLSSVLQSFNRFIIPALAPVAYNFGLILFLLLFSGQIGVYAPAAGMVFGSILHMGIQLPVVRKFGYSYKPLFNIKDKGVREIYRLMLPRTIGLTAQRLIYPVYTNLALFISAPSNVFLTFASDLQAMPVRLFGLSIGQAAVPIFSKTFDEGDLDGFKALLLKTVQQVAFFVLPASVLLFILRVPLVRLAVGASKYSWPATVMTAYTLGFFSISLFAQAVIAILTRAFYALCDTKTPVKISIFTILVNVALAFAFVKGIGLGVWSIAFAFSIANILNLVILSVAIYKRLGGFDINSLINTLNKIGLASFFMGVALYIPMKVLDQLIFDTTRTIWLIVLTLVVTTLGLGAYFVLSVILKVEELQMIKSVIYPLRKTLNKISIEI